MRKIFVFLLCFVLCFVTLTVFIAAEEPGAADPGVVIDSGADEQPGVEDPGAAEQSGAEDPGAAEQPGAEDPGQADPGVMFDAPSGSQSFNIQPGTYNVVVGDYGDRYPYYVNGTVDGLDFASFVLDNQFVVFYSDIGMTEEVDSFGSGQSFSVSFEDDVVYTTFQDSAAAESMFFATFSDSEPSEGLLGSILAVFMSIISWIIPALTTVVSLFWSNGTLTLFGWVTLASLGIGIFFLLVHVITRFLRFRS